MARAVEAEIQRACEGLGQFPYANPATDIAHVYRMPLPKRGCRRSLRGGRLRLRRRQTVRWY